jgi:hypothetical protein
VPPPCLTLTEGARDGVAISLVSKATTAPSEADVLFYSGAADEASLGITTE